MPKTVDKNGVIIANGNEKNDLISQAIENGGTLPDNFNTMPIERTAPGRRLAPAPTPAPAKPADPTKKELTIEPTQPGPPKSGSDPTRAPATQPTTPATPPPTDSGVKP